MTEGQWWDHRHVSKLENLWLVLFVCCCVSLWEIQVMMTMKKKKENWLVVGTRPTRLVVPYCRSQSLHHLFVDSSFFVFSYPCCFTVLCRIAFKQLFCTSVLCLSVGNSLYFCRWLTFYCIFSMLFLLLHFPELWKFIDQQNRCPVFQPKSFLSQTNKHKHKHKTLIMSRSRKKVVVKNIDAGYATSDECFNKEERRVARKAHRRKMKTTTNHFVSLGPNGHEHEKYRLDESLPELLVEKRQKKWEGCRYCAKMCRTPTSCLNYSYCGERDQQDLDRYEQTNKIAVLRRYRRTKFKWLAFEACQLLYTTSTNELAWAFVLVFRLKEKKFDLFSFNFWKREKWPKKCQSMSYCIYSMEFMRRWMRNNY